jgi:predicted metal-binding protein
MPIKQIELIIDYHVRYLCEEPYPNHPKGCPNYRRKLSCPPGAPFIETVIDLSKPVYAIWNVFDFASHTIRMYQLHPDWSQRQLECCLYWQGTARKKLKELIFDFQFNPDHISYEIFTCPEAIGINVTETMKSIGEILEWPPVTKAYQVVIAGVRK